MVQLIDDDMLGQMAKVIADSFSEYPLIRAVIGEVHNLEEVMYQTSLLNLTEFIKHGDAHLLDGTPQGIVLGYHSKSVRPITRTVQTIRLFLLLRRLLSKEDFRTMWDNLKLYDKVMDLKWPYRHIKGDFYYVKVVAIDPAIRGSGAFRKLMSPVLDGCDDRGLPIVLESHDERVAAIYSHYGFETVEVIEQDGLNVRQHCMIRRPPQDSAV